MGTSILSQFGAISTWPALGSWALLTHLKDVCAYRYNEVPVASSRSIKRYVRQSSAGSSSGGSGDGSEATPWLVRHAADLRTLVAAIGATGMGLMFARGDVIPASPANADQGFDVAWSDFSVGAYGAGSRRPEITGFGAPTVGPSLGGGVATYSGLGSLRVYWVRGRTALSTRDGYWDQPYQKMSSTGSVLSTPYSWFDDGAGTVTVNYGAHDPSLLEFCYATGNGIWLRDYDMLRVDDIEATGWGTNAPGTANGGMCFRSSASGTSSHVFSRCRAAWSGYHTTAQIVSAGGAAGGFVSWFFMELGYHQWDGGGTGDCNVCYNAQGGQEFVRWNCQQLHGGLQAEGVTVIPQSFYAHTAGGSVYPAVGIDMYSTIDPATGAPLTSAVFCVDHPAITDTDDVSQYRTFRHGRRIVSKGLPAISNAGFESNLRVTFKLAVPGGSFVQPHGASGNGRLLGLQVNLDEVYELLAGTWTGKGLRIFDANAAMRFDLVHPRRRIIGATPASGIAMQWGTHLANCAEWNGVISNETAASFDLTDAANHYPETDPALNPGGLSAPACFGVTTSEYNSCPSPVNLAAAGDWQTAAGVASSCRQSSLALRAGMACEYDLFEQRRSSDPTKRSRGPIEADPIVPGGAKPISPAIAVAL